jgi:hypothetical protein
VSTVNWDLFDLGFWHPFGPYTGLSVSEILEWKRTEVTKNGWTLWSFAYYPAAAQRMWIRHLGASRHPILALCSASPGARDPDAHRGERRPTHYRFLEENSAWSQMPEADQLRVTNPFRRSGKALAFKVIRVVELAPQIPPFSVEWLARGKGEWSSRPLPTRGEYLLRRGGAAKLRPICVVLELAPPYLAELTWEPPSADRC